MAKAKSVIYVTTYIDETVHNRTQLPFSPAGLNKKRQLIKGLTGRRVFVLFVCPFSRWKNTFFASYTRKIGYKSALVSPFFSTLAGINFFINPIFVYLALRRVMRSSQVEAAILYNPTYTTVVVGLILRMSGLRYLVQLEDGVNPNSFIFARFWSYLCMRLGIRLSSGVIFNNLNFASYCTGVPTLLFRGIATEPKILGSKHEGQDPPFRLRIVYSGSIDNIRGATILKMFFNELRDSDIMTKVSFEISGFGKESSIVELKNAILRYKRAGGEATYHGFLGVARLRELYEDADVFLILQNDNDAFSRESFPSKVIDYIPYGCPIITTDVSDLKKDNYLQRLIFIERTVEGLRAALSELILDYDKALHSAKILSKDFCEEHSLPKFRHRLDDFLKITSPQRKK